VRAGAVLGENVGNALVGERAVLHRTRLEKIYRDARLTQIFEGTNQINRLAVIEDLQEDFTSRIATGAHS